MLLGERSALVQRRRTFLVVAAGGVHECRPESDETAGEHVGRLELAGAADGAAESVDTVGQRARGRRRIGGLELGQDRRPRHHPEWYVRDRGQGITQRTAWGDLQLVSKERLAGVDVPRRVLGPPGRDHGLHQHDVMVLVEGIDGDQALGVLDGTLGIL